MSPEIPDRYNIEVTEFRGKQEKAIFRKDLQKGGNRVHIVRGLSVSQEELLDKHHPRNYVYLDGAAQGPFYDKKRGIWSLDHHDDCVRQITDATCVQAMKLARTRVIGALGHTIPGNDPDRDTVFAAWELLNADLIAHDDHVFYRILPLMILEGNIDGNGLGFEELTGLSQEVISATRQRISWLMQEERELKSRGRWNTVDYVDFTEDGLRKIDRYALYRDSLDEEANMQVHDTLELKNGQKVQYVQAPDSGIYEVEYTILHHKGQKDTACIIFHDGKSKFTIKLSGFVNDLSCAPIIEALNIREDALRVEQNVTDPAMLNARWGGGDIIFGPPRYPNGSGSFVSKEHIIEIIMRELNAQIAS